METQVTRAWVMNKLAEQMNTAHLFNKEHRDLQEDRLAQLDQRLAEATLTFTERLEAGIRQELTQQLAVNESAAKTWRNKPWNTCNKASSSLRPRWINRSNSSPHRWLIITLPWD